jgi:HEPN domain-containing protein
MADRSDDWITQGRRDLASARAQREDGFHEWACFIAQQGAEKALKAVLQRWGAEAWGHSIVGLLEAVGERVALAQDMRTAARTLDRYYIPARYPNGYAQGTPADYIHREDADAAINGAEEILRFCDGLLAGS